MKKLVFGLIAIVLFSVSGNAQKQTQEDIRLILAKQMVSFTNALKPAYQQAKDFNDFEKIVCGDWLPATTKQGHSLLQASYNLISKKTSDADIVKSYSGKEMANVVLLHNENLKKGIRFPDGSEIFGGTTGDFNPYSATNSARCRWYEIACWFDTIFGPVMGPKALEFALNLAMGAIGGGSGQ